MNVRFFLSTILHIMLPVSPALADTFVRDDINTQPQPSGFSVCHGNTCTHVSDISLTDSQWQKIRDIFQPLPRDPHEERQRIAEAITHMEIMVGEITDTSADKARTMENVRHLYVETQMDCIDESTNTTIYLTMMQDNGLLQWHHVEDRSTRGFFIFGWPHTTAVIRDITSNMRYAVDSWFEDNGKPPYIIPLTQWKDGWEPGK